MLKEVKQTDVMDFFNSQLMDWDRASSRFMALEDVKTKVVDVDGFSVTVQYNPARIVSSAAKTDAKSIGERPCFLCAHNRPDAQRRLDLGDYELLVNPFPICRFHLTIPSTKHEDQQISGRIGDMVKLAWMLDGCTVLYNGPKCGASAPDHFHFQTVDSGELPLVGAVNRGEKLPFGVIILDADEEIEIRFSKIMSLLPHHDGEYEPRVNILAFRSGSGVKVVIIPRRKHRPDCYGPSMGELLASPASVDLAGLFVAPREAEYLKLNAGWLKSLFDELCYTQPQVDEMTRCRQSLSVGIAEAESVVINLVSGFDATGIARYSADEIEREHGGCLMFDSHSGSGVFDVEDVVIGKDFHWQRKERQRFSGNLELKVVDGKIFVINHVDVETYLKSVISSEMSAGASLEFLKAHAVISRSWVLSQIENRTRYIPSNDCRLQKYDYCDNAEIVRWYDHDDHKHYDVCADDHCQRYQGLTRQTTPKAAEAVEATRGEVLVYDGKICDARFSKCCGGVMEEFESCWDDTPHPYLQPLADKVEENDLPDLRGEDTARRWIESRPEAFCNTDDEGVLGQVLNNYDRETHDFYRWEVEYGSKELGELIHRKSGIDLGDITDILPLERGRSSRIKRLRLCGTKRCVTVGKELEIRRWLSETHLYSSAFVVDKTDSGFLLKGAGWGHGVGLCQIGAAVMAEKGYDYRSILAHYYPGSKIERR